MTALKRKTQASALRRSVVRSRREKELAATCTQIARIYLVTATWAATIFAFAGSKLKPALLLHRQELDRSHGELLLSPAAERTRSYGADVSTLVMRVIPGRRSEAEASPQSILHDLWLGIPGSRPAAEPRNDGTVCEPFIGWLYRSVSMVRIILRSTTTPRPEERAPERLSKEARISKDGHKRDRAPRPSFETAAQRARPPQDEVRGVNALFDMIGFTESMN